jgi:threonine/homoserine/homoserine lactone efflux protein
VTFVPSIESLIAFGIASLALLVIPGPAVLYIINRSVTDGRNVALAAVAGLEIGNFMHVIAATVGLSAVIAASATAFLIVKWIGAGYLVYIGIRTLVKRPQAVTQASDQMSRRRAFTQGIVVNTFNPKVALFFLSFLPQFIDANRGSAALQSLILGTTFVVLGSVSDSLFALLASALRGTLLRGKSLPFVQRYVAGTVFIALGAIASSTRR